MKKLFQIKVRALHDTQSFLMFELADTKDEAYAMAYLHWLFFKQFRPEYQRVDWLITSAYQVNTKY